MGDGTSQKRLEHHQRAEDAHRRLLEEAAQRGTQWLDDEAPTRVERVIIGGGLTATLAWATRAPTKGTCLVLAHAEEPWWSRREHRLGQPASELVSEGFVLQPHEFADDIDGFAPASALADAIAVTAHAHGMPLVLGHGVDRPVERTADGRFAIYVGGRRIEADHVDVAVGPGPARRLGPDIVTGEDESTLLADGRMVFGQDQWKRPVRLPRVLDFGGGATAAWNVELALRCGADVTWVAAAPSSSPKHTDPLRLKAQKITAHLENRRDIDTARLRWLERVRSRILAFRGADLPRNREVFRAHGVEWWMGSVERLRPRDDNAVEALIRSAHDGQVQQLHFEQVVVSIGQDERAAEAAASLVANMPITWIEHDWSGPRPSTEKTRPSGRIIGACATTHSPPRLRCLGVLLNGDAWRERLRRAGRRRSNAVVALEERLKEQAAAAPRHSQGIPGAVFQVSANVVLANGKSIDPSLGTERHALLLSTIGVDPSQRAVATSSGVGG